MTTRITDDDWVKPLVLLREIAEQYGVFLSDEDEQEICREVVEGITLALMDEVQAKL